MKVLKITVAIVLILVFALSFAACSKTEEDKVSANGVWTYAENDDGTITITGVKIFSENMVVPAELDGKAVSALGEKAFVLIDNSSKRNAGVYLENKTLKTVTIEAPVKSIPAMCFYYCVALTNVTLPETVTSIGAFSFFNCSSLPSIVLPEKCEEIGEYSFRQCTSLTSVTILNNGEEVVSLGAKAFYCLDEKAKKSKQYYISDSLSIYVQNIELYNATRLEEKRINTKNDTYKFWEEYANAGSIKSIAKE